MKRFVFPIIVWMAILSLIPVHTGTSRLILLTVAAGIGVATALLRTKGRSSSSVLKEWMTTVPVPVVYGLSALAGCAVFVIDGSAPWTVSAVLLEGLLGVLAGALSMWVCRRFLRLR